MTIKYVFISSPYTLGDTNANVRTSLLAANILMEHGFVPFAPLQAHLWDLITPKRYMVWHDYCLDWLRRCDAVLRIPGKSRGADDEVRLATELGIPVFYSMASLLLARDKT